MKSRTLLFTFILVLALSACNLPSNAPTQTPTLSLITPSATQPLATDLPTQTPLPSNTAPPLPTSTPSVPVAFPRDVAVNCRLGPGTSWLSISALNVGANAQIVGKTGDGSWWNVVDPLNSGRRCWVASSVTNTAGNLAGIPVTTAPTAAVTNVSIDLDPDTVNVAGCVGPVAPIEITGTIETNGPAIVQWRFETQQGGAMTTNSTEFESFGEEEVSVNYTPTLSAGTYWVRLIVTSPNSMQAETRYTITCP